MKKKIAILGSTGSIGMHTLDVVDKFPEEFQVVGLSAGNNIGLLSKLIKKYKPHKVALINSERAKKLKDSLGHSGVSVLDGIEGLNELATSPEVEIVVAAMSGSDGLIPILEAIKKGKTIILANKEPLVMAGALVVKEVKRSGARIIPVDSEHNALFQCLEGRKREEISAIILTCSGGPFYNLPEKRLSRITPSMALRHPRWKMGRKITIDSATLMNKGLEIIEATYLFELELSMVNVLIHPEAIVHGMVEFIDGQVLGLLGQPDMRLPIQHALFYPERRFNSFPKLKLENIAGLHFYPPDEKKFPCLSLAKQALTISGTMTVVLNAANEICVEAFLKNDIRFLDIPRIIEHVMYRHRTILDPDLDEILSQDRWAREEAKRRIYE